MHNIYTVTDTESVYKAEGGYDVDVVCKLDVDNSLLNKLVSSEEDYRPDLINTSPVIMRVFIANEYIKSESHLLLYAELLAIVNFMHIEGLNCFGVTDRLPTIYDVKFNVSSSDLSLLLSHDKFFINDLQDGKASYLLGRCDPFLAYLYGANSTVISDCALLDELRSIRETVESKSDRTRVSSGQIKSLLNLVTSYGVLTITFRTVVEYLNLPIHKEMQSEDGVKFGRVFDSIERQILNSGGMLPSDNEHSVKIKRKFGKKSFSLRNDSGITLLIDLVPTLRSGKHSLIVVGFRHLYSKPVMSRLKAKGYLK